MSTSVGLCVPACRGDRIVVRTAHMSTCSAKMHVTSPGMCRWRYTAVSMPHSRAPGSSGSRVITTQWWALWVVTLIGPLALSTPLRNIWAQWMLSVVAFLLRLSFVLTVCCLLNRSKMWTPASVFWMPEEWMYKGSQQKVSKINNRACKAPFNWIRETPDEWISLLTF